MSLEIYLTTSEKPPDYREPDVYNCLIWAVKPVKQRQPSFLYDSSSPGSVWTTPTSRKQSAATMRRVNKSDLAALGFPKPGEMRVVDIGPCEEGE